MSGVTPGATDPVAGLKRLLAWEWFLKNEPHLVDFAKHSYQLTAQMTLHQGDMISTAVAARIETYVRKQTSLYLTLRRSWPNHRPSDIARAHLVAAALVSQLLVGHHYWQSLQAP